MLTSKKIVLGVCGGIAAYKVVELASRLRKANAEVTVIMTKSATQFVTPLTFREITGQPVITSMWDEPKKWNVEHIALAQRADLFVIAPATANIIGKIASGIADDMLSTTLLATRAPVLVVPAMNDQMYLHTNVQENLKKLEKIGYLVMNPGVGSMACGTFGPGRLPEPLEIFEEIEKKLLPKKQDLKGKKVLVTAGGTQEAIDPVRFIGNRSSGKMGIAIAKAALDRGAMVHLIAGAISVEIPKGILVTTVESTQDMYEAVLEAFENSTILIKAAAVADYRVTQISNQKLKKTNNPLEIHLVENPDILKEVAKKKKKQIVVGFAAETENLVENGQKKLHSKKLDMLIANDVSNPNSTFNSDTNQIRIITPDKISDVLPIASKDEVAHYILDEIVGLISQEKD